LLIEEYPYTVSVDIFLVSLLREYGFGRQNKMCILFLKGDCDALKTFLNWAAAKQRIIQNPLEYYTPDKQDPERKGVLTPEQFITLLSSTISKNSIIGRSTGEDRALLYALAGCSGLRKKNFFC